jgi:hypothetical protein
VQDRYFCEFRLRCRPSECTDAVAATVPQTATTKAKESKLDEQYSISWFEKDMSSMTGEPLKEHIDPNNLDKPIIERSLARWLRAAMMCNTEIDAAFPTTTIKTDLQAIASMKPGKNFVRAGIQADKIGKNLEAGTLSPSGTDHLSSHLRMKEGLEVEQQAAITGTGAARKQWLPKKEDLPSKAQKILELPLETICPAKAYREDIYSYSLSRSGKSVMNLVKQIETPASESAQGTSARAKSNGKRSVKSKGLQQRAPSKKITLPDQEDASKLAAVADAYFRCLTYLYTQQGYKWEDDKVCPGT